MLRFTLKRLLTALPTLLLVSVAVFAADPPSDPGAADPLSAWLAGPPHTVRIAPTARSALRA